MPPPPRATLFPYTTLFRSLAVRALHEADARAGGEQPLQVLRGPEEVGLHADADVGVPGPHAAGQVERRVHVARLLHVDPDEVAEGGRPLGEGAHVGETARGIDVEPELRRLDGYLGIFARAE